MRRPAPVQLHLLPRGQDELPTTLGVGETIPQRHRNCGPFRGRKLEQCRDRRSWHDSILSLLGLDGKALTPRPTEAPTMHLPQTDSRRRILCTADPKLTAAVSRTWPFTEGGGRRRAAEGLGAGPESMLHELNEVLAA